MVGLAERIENLHGHDNLGREVLGRKLVPGEFRFPEAVTRINYDVILNPPSKLTDLSHVSWLSKQQGLLMLGDLLPTVGMGATPILNLNFDLPQLDSASSRDFEGQRYVVARPEQAVFVVGPSLRKKTTKVGPSEIRVVTAGDWAFNDNEVSKC